MTRRALVVLVALAVGAACGARERALSVTLAGLDGTRAALVATDKAAQEHIVATAETLEGGRAELDRYRVKREPVVRALLVAYSALALASVEPSTANVGEAIRQASALYQAVKAFREALAAPGGMR